MKTKSTIFHRKLMMKTASLIVLSIIICACSTNNKSLPSGIEIIPVEVDEVSQDVSLFLEKIEIGLWKRMIHLYFIDVIKSFMIKGRICL